MQPGRDRGSWPVARQLSAGDTWRRGAEQEMQNRAKANGESVHIAEKPKSWPELCAAGQRKQATMQQPNWAPTADCTKNSWAAAAAGDADGEAEGGRRRGRWRRQPHWWQTAARDMGESLNNYLLWNTTKSGRQSESERKRKRMERERGERTAKNTNTI